MALTQIKETKINSTVTSLRNVQAVLLYFLFPHRVVLVGTTVAGGRTGVLAFSTAEGVELVSGLSGLESALGVPRRRFRWRLFLRSSPLGVSTVYDLGVPALPSTVPPTFLSGSQTRSPGGMSGRILAEWRLSKFSFCRAFREASFSRNCSRTQAPAWVQQG